MQDAPGRTLAHHLGRGLQLTNILRDLDEDDEDQEEADDDMQND